MGRFERKARRAAAEEASAEGFDAKPGKLMLRAKVEYSQDGEEPPVYHTTMDCNGTELLQVMSILAVDFVRRVVESQPDADAGVELAALLAQVQLGSVSLLARGDV